MLRMTPRALLLTTIVDYHQSHILYKEGVVKKAKGVGNSRHRIFERHNTNVMLLGFRKLYFVPQVFVTYRNATFKIITVMHTFDTNQHLLRSSEYQFVSTFNAQTILQCLATCPSQKLTLRSVPFSVTIHKYKVQSPAIRGRDQIEMRTQKFVDRMGARQAAIESNRDCSGHDVRQEMRSVL